MTATYWSFVKFVCNTLWLLLINFIIITLTATYVLVHSLIQSLIGHSPLLVHSSPSQYSVPANKSSPIPDTSSPVFPDRFIRPLPKRRIKDRLSAQQQEEITATPPPTKEAPLFSFPYPSRDVEKTEGNGEDEKAPDQKNGRRDVSGGSGADRSPLSKSSPRAGTGSSQRQRTQARSSASKTPPAPLVSNTGDWASSSVDGDEGFENTNNKKKRKNSQPQHATIGNNSSSNVPLDTSKHSQPSVKEIDSFAGAEVEQPSPSPSQRYSSVPPISPVSASSTSVKSRMMNRPNRGSTDRRPLTTSTNAVNLSGSARSRLSPATKSKFQPVI
jgi:hypothetical protein